MAATAARRVVREIPRASLFVYSTDAVQKMKKPSIASSRRSSRYRKLSSPCIRQNRAAASAQRTMRHRYRHTASGCRSWKPSRKNRNP